MNVMTLTSRDVIIREGPVTRRERDALPEDGRRHELLDGMLVMSPAPSRRHQKLAFQLAVRLDAAVPREFEVMMAPFDVPARPPRRRLTCS